MAPDKYLVVKTDSAGIIQVWIIYICLYILFFNFYVNFFFNFEKKSEILNAIRSLKEEPTNRLAVLNDLHNVLIDCLLLFILFSYILLCFVFV